MSERPSELSDPDAIDRDCGGAARRSWLPFVAVAVPLGLVFLALLLRAGAMTWVPEHDFALIELHTRDVGTARTPLVGPYSRYGWNHPGPLMYYLLASPYRLFGAQSSGLLVGAVVINAAAAAGSLLVARRRGGPWLLVGVAVLFGVLLHSLGAELIMSPWNPWITVLPAVLFVLLAWSVCLRDWLMIPFAAGVATFLVQTHVSYSLIVATVLVVAAIGAWRLKPADPSPATTRRLRPMLAIAAAVLLALWLPVVIDLARGRHNLAAIARWFLQDDSVGSGWQGTLGLLGRETGPGGPWLTGTEPLVPFSGAVEPTAAAVALVPFVALLLGVVVAARRRDRDGIALLAVAAAALVAASISLSQIEGPILVYLVRFLWPVAAVVWLAVAREVLVAVAAVVPDRVAPRARSTTIPAVAGAIALVLLAASSLPGMRSARVPDPEASARAQPMVEAVVPAVGAPAGLAAAGGPVLVRPLGLALSFPAPSDRGLSIGLFAALDAAGVDVRFLPGDWPYPDGDGGDEIFGDAYADDGGAVTGTLTVASGDQLDAYVAPPGSRVLYRSEPDADKEERRRLDDELRTAFVAAGHPEAVADLRDDDLRWIPFNVPELGVFGDEIERLAQLRAQPREAVFWHDGR